MPSNFRRNNPSSKSSSRVATSPPKKKTGQHVEFLYGIQSVHAALLHRKRPLWALHVKEKASSPRIEQLKQIATQLGISIKTHKPKELDSLCPIGPHQGVVLACGALPYVEFEPLKDGKHPQIFVALDQIEDPHNLGAIIRSCSFFKVSGVVVPRQHTSPLTPTVSKTSAGTVEHFPVVAVPNLARFLTAQKKQGYWVVGLDMQAEHKVASLCADRSYILVVGNEGRGLRQLVHSLCDWCVQIPGETQVASLNVSNATAIALHQLTQPPPH